MVVWDFSKKFTGEQVGVSLARVWQVQGQRLSPTVDARGVEPHCPITLEPFVDPILLSDGCVYDRGSVTEWLRTHDTSPCTNEPLQHRYALRLQPLREAVETLLAISHNLQGQSAEDQLKLVTSKAEGISGPLPLGHATMAVILDRCMVETEPHCES